MTIGESCPAIRQGDEVYCPVSGCGLRWGLGENRPECPVTRRLKEVRGYVDELHELGAPRPEPVHDFGQRMAELRERIEALKTINEQIREVLAL